MLKAIARTLVTSVMMLTFGIAHSVELKGVRAGMTRAEVVAAVGEPESSGKEEGREYLLYLVCQSNCAAKSYENRRYDRYLVWFKDGKVDAVARKDAAY